MANRKVSLRIGYDAKRAATNLTGLGNFSRMIIEAVANELPAASLELYHTDRNSLLLKELVERNRNLKISGPSVTFGIVLKSFWRYKGVVRQLKLNDVDIYHGLSGELPHGISRSGVKSILTVHDLIFMRHPEFYKPVDRFLYERKLRNSCLEADHIVAISERTKYDLIELLDISESKISVIYQGCSADFSIAVDDVAKEKLRKKYDLPEKFVLYVGTIEERKNLLTLVKAVHKAGPDVFLVAVGRSTKYQKKVEQYILMNNLSDRVKIFNGIGGVELPLFYQSATLFAYPSLYEGFGIPIIEAISAGLPVLGATGSCLEEAGGEGGVYVDPFEYEQMAAVINRMISSEDMRENMVLKGKQHILKFKNETIAHQYIELYRKITGH